MSDESGAAEPKVGGSPENGAIKIRNPFTNKDVVLTSHGNHGAASDDAVTAESVVVHVGHQGYFLSYHLMAGMTVGDNLKLADKASAAYKFEAMSREEKETIMRFVQECLKDKARLCVYGFNDDGTVDEEDRHFLPDDDSDSDDDDKHGYAISDENGNFIHTFALGEGAEEMYDIGEEKSCVFYSQSYNWRDAMILASQHKAQLICDVVLALTGEKLSVRKLTVLID